ncbi:hypothetical protein KR222_005750 [Zaprionus bogoriensis]|nr:hypothetical protein KR222_005750 [Zaprionus bogoriensis]
MKLIAVFCLVLCLALSHVDANCSGDCPDTEEVVWALDNVCHVFRNKCYFDKENCDRKSPLTISSRVECQQKCCRPCPLIYRPITGTYMSQKRRFDNLCEMQIFSCKTGASK